MKRFCSMPPPRRCYEVIAVSIFREGSRPSGCPRPMRRSWLQRNRLTETLRCTHPVPKGFCFSALRHISLVKFRSGGLGYSNAKTARPILPGAQNSAFCPWDIPTPITGEYPIALAAHHTAGSTTDTNLTNQPGIIVRTSGANIVTRYRPAHQVRQNSVCVDAGLGAKSILP
jgi:hypothetical protein